MIKKTPDESLKKNIAKLVEKDFVWQILTEHLPDHYPDFVHIKNLELDPYKRHLGATSAVFVVEYRLEYLSRDSSIKPLTIFVSAHSDASRRGAYHKTKFLYEHGFDKGLYRVTRPLFFLESQLAFFYESSPGRSLFNFFTQNPEQNLKPTLILVAAWIKKLHGFERPLGYSWPDFKIAQMIPEPIKFIADFYNDSQSGGQLVDNLFKGMLELEKKFNKSLSKRLIYGDYHPENIIVEGLNTDHLVMIDFTDVSLGDPMADIGTFIQQFDFMGHNFISRKEINDYKHFFVEEYFGKNFGECPKECIARINLYQSWTALRTAVFLFYMKDIENPVSDLLADSQNYLELARNQKQSINLYGHE